MAGRGEPPPAGPAPADGEGAGGDPEDPAPRPDGAGAVGGPGGEEAEEAAEEARPAVDARSFSLTRALSKLRGTLSLRRSERVCRICRMPSEEGEPPLLSMGCSCKVRDVGALRTRCRGG